MAKPREPKLRSTLMRPPEPVTPERPLRLALKLENTSGSTIHVSNQIHALRPSADGKTLEVSTARPELASNVHVNLTTIPTTPVDPGQSTELELVVTLPLRLVSLTGPRGSAVNQEWMPAGDLDVRVTLAYGDQPFYLPADSAKMNEAIRGWTQRVELAPLKVRVDPKTQA